MKPLNSGFLLHSSQHQNSLATAFPATLTSRCFQSVFLHLIFPYMVLCWVQRSPLYFFLSSKTAKYKTFGLNPPLYGFNNKNLMEAANQTCTLGWSPVRENVILQVSGCGLLLLQTHKNKRVTYLMSFRLSNINLALLCLRHGRKLLVVLVFDDRKVTGWKCFATTAEGPRNTWKTSTCDFHFCTLNLQPQVLQVSQV